MKLVLSDIICYSKLDEESFEFYLKNITNKIEHIGSNIIIQIDKRTLNKEMLRNTFGLIKRYNLKVENIDELITNKNHDYILNPNAYWYKYFDKKNSSSSS